MKITKTAMILSSTLCLSSTALTAEPIKLADQIIEVEIQSEPMRLSSKKPTPNVRANTRMSATVAQIEADGTVTLDCENQHAHQHVQQLQTEPR